MSGTPTKAKTAETNQTGKAEGDYTLRTDADNTADVQAADAAGISEGEVKALRADAGLNELAGHQANITVWANSDAGKQFLADEKDRVKESEESAKKAHAPLDTDKDLSEAEKKYVETVSK